MSALWYPSYVKQAPLQGMTGLWGGLSSNLTGGGAITPDEWSNSNLPSKHGGDSNVTFTILNGATSNSILQIYYATTVAGNSSSNTASSNTQNQNQHTCVSSFDLSGYTANTVTFYGVGAGGGGSTGPCSNGGGGGGGAFKIAVPGGDSSLSSLTLKTGMRGRGAHQQTQRQNSTPGNYYGVGTGAFDGGLTAVTFSGGGSMYANGGAAGVNDGCGGQPGGGGGGNSTGGTAGSSGDVSFADSTGNWTGGTALSGGHTGKTGGGAAFPGGYISGSETGGAAGSAGVEAGGDGTWGQGGTGCTVLSNAGATTQNSGGQTGTPDQNHVGCRLYSGDSNGFGGGGGNAETDGGLNTWTGYSGHGAMAAIWIELT